MGFLERSPRIQPDLLLGAVRSTQRDDASIHVYVRHRVNRERPLEHLGFGLDYHDFSLIRKSFEQFFGLELQLHGSRRATTSPVFPL